MLVTQSCPTLCNPMDCSPPLSIGFSRQDTGVGSHFLLQGMFPIQGLNLGLLPCRQILYDWAESVIIEAYSGVHMKIFLLCKKPIQKPKSFPHFSRNKEFVMPLPFQFYVRLRNTCHPLSELLRTTIFWYHSTLLQLMWIQYSIF